ncbi:MAG: aldehyde dehydrogenase family protein, partial [Burkholderiales bacterium]
MSRLLVGADWREGTGPVFSSCNPVTQITVWSGHAASPADVNDAVVAARTAFGAWSSTPLEARLSVVRAFAALLEERRAVIANVIGMETGKPLWEALTEVTTMIGKIEISIKAYQ